ncbi:MAG TPA: ROK family protein [Aeromicrobium sp.]|nr:ROK family protein [Aeromicrobium sp.]
MPDSLAVGLDIGGTKIAAGLVDAQGEVLEFRKTQTPTGSAAELLDEVDRLVRELTAVGTATSIGIGAAAYIDRSADRVAFSPHLPLRDEPLRAQVAERTGLPTVVDNDANAAGWAEWRFGAARGEDSVVLVTVGTGLGGAIVLNGELVRGATGMAAEFGHQRFVADGPACECGNFGCWEQFASGRVLDRRAQSAIASGDQIGSTLIELAGSAEHVDGSTVSELALLGNQEAISWLADLGEALGIGLANLAAVLDPGIFVIGGGVCQNEELLLEPARRAFAQQLTGRGHRKSAKIVAAELGNQAGLVGAADLSRH